jgi:hypothetical protein
MPRMTAPVFCNFLYASRNPLASMVQPGVSAFGKKNRTIVLPLKSFNDTFFPFSSGKLKSGALSLISMAVSPYHKSLYRRAGWLVIIVLLVVAGGPIIQAQYGKRRTISQGPRALGLIELAANGKARLIPITILFQGKFYDAGAYKASPVPMALEPRNVYEAERNGTPQGLFTITDVRQLKGAWIADGTWLPAGTAPPKPAHSADEKPIMGDTDAPPVLRRPASEKTAPQTQPDSKTPAPQPTMPPASPSAPATPNANSTSAQASPPEDNDHPQLRRGKPKQPNGPDDVIKPAATIPSTTRGKMGDKPGTAETSAGAATSGSAVQLLPAISDADGPDPRSYAYDMKPEEEQNYRKKMLAMAAEEIRARAKQTGAAGVEPSSARTAVRQQHRSAASASSLQPSLQNLQLRFFDLSSSSEPILVLTASARMPAASASLQNSDLQYFVTVVARADIYGELRKLHSSVTDTRHLDAIPRMELIDAVDADGDGRGELLFRQISDAGSAFDVYRVTGDQLWPLFEGTPQ